MALSPIAKSFACQAYARPPADVALASTQGSVGVVPGVPFGAVSHKPASQPTLSILGGGDEAEVQWVHAVPGATEMINLKASGDKPMAHHVGNSVREEETLSRGSPEQAIPVVGSVTCPKPAGFGLVDFGPESLRQGMMEGHGKTPSYVVQSGASTPRLPSIIPLAAEEWYGRS